MRYSSVAAVRVCRLLSNLLCWQLKCHNCLYMRAYNVSTISCIYIYNIHSWLGLGSDEEVIFKGHRYDEVGHTTHFKQLLEDPVRCILVPDGTCTVYVHICLFISITRSCIVDLLHVCK